MSVKRVIIAGSRKYSNLAEASVQLDHLFPAGEELEVVCGEAEGADTVGKLWAIQRKHKVKSFPADWDNLDVKGAVIRKRRDGKQYNAVAGHIRNEQMALYAKEEGNGYLVTFWDGKSPGTKSMISLAKRHGLKVTVFIIDPNAPIPDPFYDEGIEVLVTLLEAEWDEAKS